MDQTPQNKTPDVQEKYRFDRRGLQGFVKDLSQPSGMRTLLALLSQWAVIVGSGVLATQSGAWLLYPCAWLVIATRQHALGILVHDAVHFRLFRNQRLNDVVSDVFCAFPLGASTSLYRDFHLNHHRYTNTERDPEIRLLHGQADWQFPKTKAQLARLFLKDVTGLNALKSIALAKSISPALNFLKDADQGGISRRERILYATFSGLLVLALSVGRLWPAYFIFWILPTGITGVIFRLRMLAEHFGVPNDKEITGTRSVLAAWPERLLISPFNVNFHLEHHMFPSVPFFNLGKLHQRLLLEPDFATKAHFTASYLGKTDSVLQELMGNGVAAPQ